MDNYTKYIFICSTLYVIYKLIKCIYINDKSKNINNSKFWKNQLNINMYKDKNNELITKNLVEIPKKYNIRSLDLYNNNDKRLIYYFLKDNYLKNQQYTIEYLQWRFKYSSKNFMIGLFNKDELIGTIFACPIRLYVGADEIINVLYVSFLCVKKELRGYNIAPILISEMIRQWKSTKYYKFPFFIIEDKPLPNMNIEKKILYNYTPIIKNKKNKKNIIDNNTVNNSIIFKEINENDDKNIKKAYELYLKLSKKEWAVFQYLDLNSFKHYLFNNKLRIRTYFIINNENDNNSDSSNDDKIVGLISLISNYVDINKNKKNKKSNNKNTYIDINKDVYNIYGDVKKVISISFIQFILLDKISNSSLYLSKKDIIKELKEQCEQNNQLLITDYIAHITDYDKNNIIEKYIFKKGFIHTYNFSFNYMNKNSQSFNMLDYGFMMLHP